MTDDSEKIIQLPLPLIWWHDTSKWRERHHVSSVQRPTEDEALDNIYAQSRAAHGHLGRRLNHLEKRVYRLELKSFIDCPKWYTEADRMKWIAEKTGLTFHMVKDILIEVSWVVRDLDTAELIQATSADTLWRDLVKEVMSNVA